MKPPKYHLYLSILLALVGMAEVYGQFKITGEFRPRTEHRQGFGTLIAEGQSPGFATSTRIRLNTSYQTDNYKLYMSLQDVMVWGENRQLLPYDQNNSFAVFEAWASLNFGGGFHTKVGRQTITYDDQRFFSALGWAQQARNHDAALLQYKNDSAGLHIDVGFAYNQDFSHPTGFVNTDQLYTTTGFFSYKTMQYIHLKKKFGKSSVSALALRNGYQDTKIVADNIVGNGTSHLNTFGTHIHLNFSPLTIKANGYLQTGQRQGKVDVKNAFETSLDVNYKLVDNFTLGLGGEILSGNDPDEEGTSAFFPLFGLNHGFNGFMDYFYVGNHANSIGLIDLHVSGVLKLGKTTTLLGKVLNFRGHQELPSGETQLGTEIDLVLTKKYDGFLIKAGYSHMLPSKGMNELKGVAEDIAQSTQNWAWVMLVIKPTFFDSSK